MRLYNTLSRGVVELPPAPALIRMYFCGPTVAEALEANAAGASAAQVSAAVANRRLELKAIGIPRRRETGRPHGGDRDHTDGANLFACVLAVK